MPKHDDEKGPKYHIWIDGTEYVVHQETITVAEIRQLGSIPPELPIILVNEDGTEETLRDDETVELKPGRRFSRAPRFVRGCGG